MASVTAVESQPENRLVLAQAIGPTAVIGGLRGPEGMLASLMAGSLTVQPALCVHCTNS